MFDIGWTELLVLAVAAILIVGPKDLPRMLYALGQAVGKMRRQADEFRRQFNESMREAGMDEVRNDMKKMSDLNPASQIRNEIEGTFRDQPKRSSKPASEASSDAAADDTAPASSTSASTPSSEGELTEGESAQPKTETPPAGEPSAEDEQPRSDRKPVGNRNVNGAAEAEAKDAVS